MGKHRGSWSPCRFGVAVDTALESLGFLVNLLVSPCVLQIRPVIERTFPFSEVPEALVTWSHSQHHLVPVPQSPQGSFSDRPLPLSTVFLVLISATAFVSYTLAFQFVFKANTVQSLNHSLYSGQ